MWTVNKRNRFYVSGKLDFYTRPYNYQQYREVYQGMCVTAVSGHRLWEAVVASKPSRHYVNALSIQPIFSFSLTIQKNENIVDRKLNFIIYDTYENRVENAKTKSQSYSITRVFIIIT